MSQLFPHSALEADRASTSARKPFFPASAYATVAPALVDWLAGLPQAKEGHISPNQAEFLYTLVRLVRPALIIETGLGVGHSASIMLMAQESVGLSPRVLSIDNCRNPETGVAAAKMAIRFPGHELISGDSREQLPNTANQFMRAKGGIALDMGFVDGGHDFETTRHDLAALYSLLRPGGYLLLDDFEKAVACPGPNLAGREFAARWGSCVRFQTADGRGFMIHQKSF